MDVFVEMHRSCECQCATHREANDAYFRTSLFLLAEYGRCLYVAQRLCEIQIVHEVSGLGNALGYFAAVQILISHVNDEIGGGCAE